MSHEETRKGVTQARLNENGSGWLFFEIVLISFLAGGFSFNWIIGLSAFLILLIMLMFRKSAIVLLVTLTVASTVIGLIAGFYIGGIIGALILGILVLLITTGFHISAYQWMNDIRE
jgi:fatty acid desaturase